MAFEISIGGEKFVYKDILPEDPDDRAYIEILTKISPYTMTLRGGLDSTFGLFQLIKYVVQNRIQGSIVECGVWRGGSMMLMSYALQHFKDTSRDLRLYDTFGGMTEPEDIDVDFDGIAMKKVWTEARDKGQMIGFGGSAQEVAGNVASTGYPANKIYCVIGDVLNTIPAHAPEKIALLRLDTDWYKSTLHELKHLYGLLSPNGILIIDDYGWCQGARQATDEFFLDQPFKPMMHRVDQSVRVIIKPSL